MNHHMARQIIDALDPFLSDRTTACAALMKHFEDADFVAWSTQDVLDQADLDSKSISEGDARELLHAIVRKRIVTWARGEDVHLDPADVIAYLRERLAREVEQAYDDAREEVCAYADCYSRATTEDYEGDPCCAAHSQTIA